MMVSISLRWAKILLLRSSYSLVGSCRRFRGDSIGAAATFGTGFKSRGTPYLKVALFTRF